MAQLWYARHCDACPGGRYRRILTGPESQHKIELSRRVGVYTEVLHLAPHMRSGHNVCPWASEGCIAACLNTAGMGVFPASQTARIRRGERYAEERQARLAARDPETGEFPPYQGSHQQGEPWSFWQDLVSDLSGLTRRAQGMRAAVRLNGTSDLAWESYPVCIDGVDYPNLMAAFPDLQFYDYSKSVVRVLQSLGAQPFKGGWPANYQLTYSLSEKSSSPEEALRVLRAGGGVAVVFRGEPPATYTLGGESWPVVDATQHDARFLDPPAQQHQGYIAGLRALGKARKDASGFVRELDVDPLAGQERQRRAHAVPSGGTMLLFGRNSDRAARRAGVR